MAKYIIIFIVVLLLLILILYYYPPKYDNKCNIKPLIVVNDVNKDSNNKDVNNNVKEEKKDDVKENGRTFSRGERLCKEILEEHLKRKIKPFNPTKENFRPSWLINPDTGRPLELDMYDHADRIALEYQGKQHYHIDGKFIKTQEQLDYQQKKDKVKVDICKEKGVKLIVVPYTVDEKYKTDEEKKQVLKEFIMKHL